MFELGVKNIGDLSKIDGDITELGKRHKNYAPTKENFDVSPSLLLDKGPMA